VIDVDPRDLGYRYPDKVVPINQAVQRLQEQGGFVVGLSKGS
jgi:hypothetical protein